MKNEIRQATRAFLALSEVKKHYGKMAVYYECYRDMGNLVARIQKKGLPPQFLFAWNTLNMLANRYNRKYQQEERRGELAAKRGLK